MAAIDIKEYVEHTIIYFRKNYISPGVEINYQLINDEKIKFKIPKSEYSALTQKLKEENIDFEVIPSERKMELVFPRHNGKNLLKTKNFNIDIYFVEPAALKTLENIENAKELNIKNWSDFFESIDPEYRNLLTHIVNNIHIASLKNEYNKVISKKTYWIDPKDGLFERKEKFVNAEWRISYTLVTNNLFHMFRMFFRFFDEIPLNELASFEKFKDIVRNTKYKTHLQ